MTRILIIGLETLWLCWPHRVRAPAGWYINGVHPSGEWEMRPVLGRPEDDLLDAVRRRVIEDDRVQRGNVWCSNGLHPRQDGVHVWCAR